MPGCTQGVQEAVLHGEQGRPGPGGDPGLGVDVLDVVADRLGGDPQRRGDLLVEPAAGDQAQHLDLAVGETGRVRGRSRQTWLAGGGQHGVDLDPSEAPGVDVGGELRRGVARSQRRAMGPVLGHRVVGVGGGEEPCAQSSWSPDVPRW